MYSRFFISRFEFLFLGNASPPPPPLGSLWGCESQFSFSFTHALARQAQFLHPRQHFGFRRDPSRNVLAHKARDVILDTQFHQGIFGELLVTQAHAHIFIQSHAKTSILYARSSSLTCSSVSSLLNTCQTATSNFRAMTTIA